MLSKMVYGELWESIEINILLVCVSVCPSHTFFFYTHVFSKYYTHDLKILCISEIELCLWAWISWSILYQMQKLMTILEPSWRADFKTVPTFSIWLRITRVIQGLIQSLILGMHKIFRLHLCICKMSVKHKLFTEESSPKGLEFRKQ